MKEIEGKLFPPALKGTSQEGDLRLLVPLAVVGVRIYEAKAK